MSYCEDNNDVHYNPWTWAETYFTTIARENGTISFNILKYMGTDMITSFSYSADNGNTWTTTANQDNKSENLVIDVTVNEGDVSFKRFTICTIYSDGRKEVVASREQRSVLSVRPGDARCLATGDRPLAQSPVLEAALAEVLLVVVFRHASDDNRKFSSHEVFDLSSLVFQFVS